jgi:hypothetical protein
MHECGLLTKQQLAALAYAAQRGDGRPAGFAMSALQQLQRRVTSLGFSADDLTRASNFLRDEAPLLIHVHSNSLPSLLNDTHYRSGWERGTRFDCPNYVSCQQLLGDTRLLRGRSNPHSRRRVCCVTCSARVGKSWSGRCSDRRTMALLPLTASSMVSERRGQIVCDCCPSSLSSPATLLNMII